MAAPIPRVPPVTNAMRAIKSSQFFRLVMPGLVPGTPVLFATSLKTWMAGTSPAMTFSEARKPKLSFQAHRDAHAAADAQRGEALFGIPLLHLIEQRHQHAGSRRADWVADGDGAAVDVDLTGIPAEVLVDGAGLGGKRFVGLDQ